MECMKKGLLISVLFDDFSYIMYILNGVKMMKIMLKNQIVELLNSLNEGIAYVEQSKNAAYETKLQVLQDCLACISPLKSSMIDNERAGKSIALLQGLETNIKKMQILLENNKPLAMTVLLTRKQILKIKEIMMKSDKRKEIVFLPYNASMWDSLESIWQAADEDENCDAYVVPIPYCDRNPDGSAKTWHYEGHDFPSYVPITNWQEYDLSKHRPDIIYIHNPYDDYNLVTSVHPNYYSKELKKYTDMLVYVPYFVSGDIVGPTKCKAPGVVNADRVIVESENIKEQYESNYPGGNPPQDKILALGSPKFDKIRNSRKEDFALPRQWEKIIKDKKIILYLTTIETMLLDTENFIKKHRYVFSVFKDRKDVALWWRPHPLLKATFESMQPELLQEYEHIVQEYKDAGWGIYDDSSDLYRAITWSDAYYGDMSSVIWLYEATGKPIIVQNVENISEHECFLSMSDIAVVGEEAWFVSRDINALFKLSISTGKVELITILDKENIFADQEYRKVIKVDGKIIIIPFFSDHGILEYDIYSKKITEFPIRSLNNCGIKKQVYFIDAIQYGDKIYLIGNGYPAILQYDVIKHTCIYYNEYAEKLQAQVEDKKNFFLVAKKIDNKLFMPFLESNIVVEFDMDSKLFTYHEVGNKDNKYAYLEFDGTNYWLVQMTPGRPIICWNYDENRVDEYEYPRECDFSRCISGYTGFCGIEKLKNKIILFPDMSNIVLEIDCNKKQIRKNEKLSLIIQDKLMQFKWFLFVAKNSENIYAFLSNDSLLIKVDENKTMIHTIPIRIQRKDVELISELSLINFINEKDRQEMILDIDIEYLKNNKVPKKEAQLIINFGQVIHNYFCG